MIYRIGCLYFKIGSFFTNKLKDIEIFEVLYFSDFAHRKNYFKEIATLVHAKINRNIQPNIVNLGFQNNHYNIALPQRKIFLFSNCSIKPFYSFIFWDSLKEVYIRKLDFTTIRLKARIAESRISLNENKLVLKKRKFKTVTIDNALSLVGHYSNHFGHFILEYYEMLNHIQRFSIDPRHLTVITHLDCDNNIRELIQEYQAKLGFTILEIDAYTKVSVRNLFWIDPAAIVTDGAYYSSITDKLFWEETRNFFIHQQAPALKGSGRKIYLVRRGKRTAVNWRELEQLFANNGYELVDPGGLSIKEKRELFGSASFVVGPAGSGFFNCIWCPTDVKILATFNYEIAFDNPLQNMLHENSKIYHFACKEIQYKFYNSSYRVDIEDFTQYAKELGFI